MDTSCGHYNSSPALCCQDTWDLCTSLSLAPYPALAGCGSSPLLTHLPAPGSSSLAQTPRTAPHGSLTTPASPALRELPTLRELLLPDTERDSFASIYTVNNNKCKGRVLEIFNMEKKSRKARVLFNCHTDTVHPCSSQSK